jgi:hypothetical protein
MQKASEGGKSPAMEFLPLLEEKLKGLLAEKERISTEIQETRQTIDELKVKLAGGELPLTTGKF